MLTFSQYLNKGTNFNGREVLLGIISFGEPECGRRGGKPGVYTNVVDHLDWIQKNLNTKSTNGCQACLLLSIWKTNPFKVVNFLWSVQFMAIISIIKADNGKPCVFPFSFRNKKYDGCTAEFDDSGKAWCSTKTSDGEHVPG